MSSGDFNLLHLRNLKMYNPDGSHPAVSSIFTISTNGVPLYTNSISLSGLSASSITTSTLNSGSIGFSTMNGSTLQASSITGSTINITSQLTVSSLTASTLQAGVAGLSTLSASTISTNLLTTNDIQLQSTQIALGLSTTSTQVNFSEGSYAASSWLTAKSGLTNPRKLGTSASGQYQLVVSGNTSDLWLSSDSGITWSQLTPASTGLPTLTGSAYWSSGTISANGQYILLGIYGGSLWMSQDYGRTFATTAQPTPDIWVQLNGNLNDAMGGAAATATGSPGYVSVQQPGFTEQAINLANTAGGAATRYVRGAWAGSPNFTVSFWMNPQTLNGTEQVVYDSYNLYACVRISSANTLFVVFPNGGGINYNSIGAVPLSTNTWYYVTYTFQTNGLCSFYVNNTLAGSLTNSQGVGSFTTTQFSLGSFTNDTQAFNGYIADFRLYNSAISYNPIPLLSPNIWLPFENNTQDAGSQSANSQGSTIYLPFEGSVADQMGVSTVTATGSPGYVAANRAGYSGQAINLVNTAGGTATQYVDGTWAGATNFSVSFWMNPQSTTGVYQYAFSSYNSFLAVGLNDTNNLFAICPSGGGSNYVAIGTTSFTASVNTWYYITVIFQTNGLCSFYVNNALIGSITNSQGVGSIVPTVFSLGGIDGNHFAAFNGYLDDFRLYNYAITYNPVSIQTVTGSLSYVPGVVGLNAVNLVNTAGGTADRYISGTWSGSSNFTISLWFNAQTINGTQQTLFAGYNNGVLILVDGFSIANSLMFVFPTGSGTNTRTIRTPYLLSPNTWYHVYAIFQSSGTCYLYVNGTLINTDTNTGFGSYTSSIFTCGTYNGTPNFAFNGYIDDFRLYNAAIPIHLLFPQNYRSVALSGSAQYALASAASGWVVGSSDYEKTWSKQSVCVGTQGDVIQPNKTGLAQNSWEQGGVNWVVSASSTFDINYLPRYAFNNNYGSYGNWWAGLAGVYSSSGSYTGIINTQIQGVGSIGGDWLQIQTTSPLILQSYRYASAGSANQLPKNYYIVGSMDGSTWFPVQYNTMIVNPLTLGAATTTSDYLVNFNGTQTTQGNQVGYGTTTTYATTTAPYTYFRVVIQSVWQSGGPATAEIGELYLNFAKPSPTALSLSYSGQYQLVATNPAAGSIMPNQTGLASSTWVQGGVQWGASASSIYSAGGASYRLFDNSAPQSWVASASTGLYNTSGTYIGNGSGTLVSTTIQGGVGSISGEWVQIQSSAPLVLQSYTYGSGNNPLVLIPKSYYLIGSMDGSTWYPLQFCSMTSKSITTASTVLSSYITVNSTGSITVGSGSGTTTSYSTSISPYMYFRLVIPTIWNSNVNNDVCEIGELYLNFSNSVSYSSNYGSTWSNTPSTLSNEIVSLSPSGQYALSTNCVPPLARLTMDNTNLDAQGFLTPATGAGTVTYSSSIVKVGLSSAFFNNVAGGGAANYLNYSVPAILATPPTLSMMAWAYRTALGAGDIIRFVNGTTTGITVYVESNNILNIGVTSTNNSDTYLSTGVTIPINTWTHIAVTYRSGELIAYVNGVNVYSNATITGNLRLIGGASITNMLLGGNYATNYSYAGYLDDVRLYTQTLTAHEIAALYSNPALTQSIGVSSSYLPITSYSKPVLPGVTANVVDAKVSQTGQYMVAVTAANTNNVYYSTDSGSSFNALSVNGYTQAGATTPLARLPLDNSNGDVLGALVPATGAGTVTYSSLIKQVGTHSAFFNNTAGSGSPSVYLNYTLPPSLQQPPLATETGWIYLTALPATNAATPFGFNNGSSNNGSTCYVSPSGAIGLTVHSTGNPAGNSASSSASTIAINTWYHVAIVFNGTNGLLYLNGSLLLTVAYTGSLCLANQATLVSTNFMVGTMTTNYAAFAGYVDDVRLYTSALTATEIAALYAGTYDSLYTVAPMAACSISNDGSYLTVANTAGDVYTLNRNATGYTLALGNQAGQLNQGSNAIAIGNLAGQLNQSANSIVLNASGSALNATAPGFYVAPIAGTAGLPMELLGYGSDSQVVRSGVTVLPGGGIYQSGSGPTSGIFLVTSYGTDRSHYDVVGSSAPALYAMFGGDLSTTSYWGTSINIAAGTGGDNPSSYNSRIPGTSSFTVNTYNGTTKTYDTRFCVRASGNVGIGTTNPGNKLSIYNGSSFVNSNPDGTNSVLTLNNANGGGSIVRFQGGNTLDGCWDIRTDSAVSRLKILNFTTFPTNYEYVSILTNGNVGIGVTNPGATLHVNGTTQIGSTTNPIYPQNPLSNNTVTIFGPARAGPTTAGTGDLNGTLFVNSTTAYGSNVGASVALGGKSADFGGGENHMTFARISGTQSSANGAYFGQFAVEVQNSGSLYQRFTIDLNGDVYLNAYTTNGTVTTINSFGQLSVSSDRRIKENIVYQSDTQQALIHVLNLKPATYSLIGSSGTYLGFIAQDVEEEIPLAVDGKKYEWQWEVAEDGKPKFDADGNIVYKLDADGNRMIRPRGIQDRAIIATQTLAIQELSKQVDSLKSQLASAQQQLADKSAKLDALIAWAQPQGFSG